MTRSVPRRVPGPVRRPPRRSRPDLEARIPPELKHLPRVCPREGCGSDNVRLRYFDNQRGAACEQPRFLCHDCHRTFTLGGKLRPKYKTSKKKGEHRAPEQETEATNSADEELMPAEQAESEPGAEETRENPNDSVHEEAIQ